MNFTDAYFNPITRGCFDWCRQQHFNFAWDGISIAAMALAFVLLKRALASFKDYLTLKGAVDEKSYAMIYRILELAGDLMIGGFMIWFAFFALK